MNLELHSIQFRNPETNEIITVTLNKFCVTDENGRPLPADSDDRLQAIVKTGAFLGSGLLGLRNVTPDCKVSGDKEE